MSPEFVLACLVVGVPLGAGSLGATAPKSAAARWSFPASAVTAILALGLLVRFLVTTPGTGEDAITLWRPLATPEAWNVAIAAAMSVATLAAALAARARLESTHDGPAMLLVLGSSIGLLFAGGSAWFAILVGMSYLGPAFSLRGAGRPIWPAVIEGGLVTGLVFASLGARSGLPLVFAGLVRSGALPFHLSSAHLQGSGGGSFAISAFSVLLGPVLVLRGMASGLPESGVAVAGAWAIGSTALAALLLLVRGDARRAIATLTTWFACLVDVAILDGGVLGRTAAVLLLIAGVLGLVGGGIAIGAAEARVGRLSLARHHGLHEHMPLIATLFLISGLALIGFPGLAGFSGVELLVESSLAAGPAAAVAVVVSLALAGVGILRIHLRTFTGARHETGIDIAGRPREHLATLILVASLLAVGLIPQFLLEAVHASVADPTVSAGAEGAIEPTSVQNILVMETP